MALEKNAEVETYVVQGEVDCTKDVGIRKDDKKGFSCKDTNFVDQPLARKEFLGSTSKRTIVVLLSYGLVCGSSSKSNDYKEVQCKYNLQIVIDEGKANIKEQISS